MKAEREKKPKLKKPTAEGPRPRFAPAAFLNGSPVEVQALCDELADVASARFSDLTGTNWSDAGRALAGQLRQLGHDLIDLEDGPELQEWHATWHHPRGTFSFLLSFRTPQAVEVAWTADGVKYSAER